MTTEEAKWNQFVATGDPATRAIVLAKYWRLKEAVKRFCASPFSGDELDVAYNNMCAALKALED